MKKGSYILYIVLWRFWFKKSKWLRYDFWIQGVKLIISREKDKIKHMYNFAE